MAHLRNTLIGSYSFNPQLNPRTCIRAMTGFPRSTSSGKASLVVFVGPALVFQGTSSCRPSLSPNSPGDFAQRDRIVVALADDIVKCSQTAYCSLPNRLGLVRLRRDSQKTARCVGRQSLGGSLLLNQRPPAMTSLVRGLEIRATNLCSACSYARTEME